MDLYKQIHHMRGPSLTSHLNLNTAEKGLRSCKLVTGSTNMDVGGGTLGRTILTKVMCMCPPGGVVHVGL